MHLELVELLRCPNTHAPTVLVASADVISNRFIITGTLGCPECLSEYPIRDGVTYFSEASFRVANASATAAMAEPQSTHVQESRGGDNAAASEAPIADSDSAMRLAAQLGLISARAAAALIGYDFSMLMAMRGIVPARLLLVNPPQLDSAAHIKASLSRSASAPPAGIVRCAAALPLVNAKFDGVAVSESHSQDDLLAGAVLTLRSGGRLVAPAHAAIPDGMREMVRDEHVWVAERVAVASTPVTLTRR